MCIYIYIYIHIVLRERAGARQKAALGAEQDK